MLMGTIVNAVAIVMGSLVGVALKSLAKHIPGGNAGENGLGARLNTLIFQALALCVLLIGITGMLQGINPLISIFAMVLGAILGEVLALDCRIDGLGDWVQNNVKRMLPPDQEVPSIAQGFVSATLLFGVGAMAIVGSLQSGLVGDHATLYAKSLMDGITSVVFASSMGIGVAFSAVAIFLYQGSIVLLACYLSPYLDEVVIAEMTCVGSLLIVALALNMLGLTKIKVVNLLPACILPVFLCMVV